MDFQTVSVPSFRAVLAAAEKLASKAARGIRPQNGRILWGPDGFRTSNAGVEVEWGSAPAPGDGVLIPPGIAKMPLVSKEAPLLRVEGGTVTVGAATCGLPEADSAEFPGPMVEANETPPAMRIDARDLAELLRQAVAGREGGTSRFNQVSLGGENLTEGGPVRAFGTNGHVMTIARQFTKWTGETVSLTSEFTDALIPVLKKATGKVDVTVRGRYEDDSSVYIAVAGDSWSVRGWLSATKPVNPANVIPADDREVSFSVWPKALAATLKAVKPHLSDAMPYGLDIEPDAAGGLRITAGLFSDTLSTIGVVRMVPATIGWPVLDRIARQARGADRIDFRAPGDPNHVWTVEIIGGFEGVTGSAVFMPVQREKKETAAKA